MIEFVLIKTLTSLKPIYLTYNSKKLFDLTKFCTMQLKITLIALIVFLAFSCKTTQSTSYTPENFEGNMLTFGTEGGFAGVTSEHYIFENGQFYSFESRNGSPYELGKIEKKVVGQIFENYTTLGIVDMKLNDPGNLSYYIKMKTKDGEKVVKWGGMNHEIPPILKSYYNNLAQIAKKHKTVTQ